MNIKKLSYFLQTLAALFRASKYKSFLISLYFGSQPIYTFKNGLTFQFQSLLDLLILKETIIDDFYQLRNIIHTNPKVIVDIWGGIGDFSIYAAKMFPRAKIIVFEPNPAIYKLLKKNIHANNIKNIIAFPKAVSTKKKLEIDISGEPTQSSVFFKNRKSRKTITVDTISLSTVLKRNKIDFLKIDCEGGEWDIIRSLSNTEKMKINIISIEYHNMYIKNVDKKISGILGSYFNITVEPDVYTADYGHLIAKKCNLHNEIST